MARLSRPDGVEIHWEERGEGPPLVFAPLWSAHPGVLEELLTDLAHDHRVITYDPRGTGRSTRTGPYDLDTDVADLEALVEEAGGGALLLAQGDGCLRAVMLGARRPDLVHAVVATGGNPLGRFAVEGTESVAASDGVVDAFRQLIETDYRAALRALTSRTNLQMSEDEVRARVEKQVGYCPQDAAIGRAMVWFEQDTRDEARALGGSLWILLFETMLASGGEIVTRTGELLPDAHIELIENGPISRPDITAGVVRRVTAPLRSAKG